MDNVLAMEVIQTLEGLVSKPGSESMEIYVPSAASFNTFKRSHAGYRTTYDIEVLLSIHGLT